MRTKGWLLVAAFAIVVLATASAFSTTAFTSVTVDREATATVEADDSAYVSLIDGHPGEGFVEQTDASTLAIDLTRGGAAGTNRDANVTLGSTDDPADDHAFRIEVRGDRARDLGLGYELASTATAGEASGPESLTFRFYHDGGDDGSIDATAAVSENAATAEATLDDVAPGDPVYAVVVVDTTGLSPASDLSGSLEVTAGEGS